ncbi:MAG: Fe-S-containing protein [Kiritimatiellia bacterium]
MQTTAVKDRKGKIRTAFNTCQICYDSGRGYYVQSGRDLVCQNCGNRFSMDQIEKEVGGCNPWPILASDKTETDDQISISCDFLAEAQVLFANWKGNI